MNRELEEIFTGVETDKLIELVKALRAEATKPTLTAEQLIALQQAGAVEKAS